MTVTSRVAICELAAEGQHVHFANRAADLIPEPAVEGPRVQCAACPREFVRIPDLFVVAEEERLPPAIEQSRNHNGTTDPAAVLIEPHVALGEVVDLVEVIVRV